jgi:hypothetical protein
VNKILCCAYSNYVLPQTGSYTTQINRSMTCLVLNRFETEFLITEAYWDYESCVIGIPVVPRRALLYSHHISVCMQHVVPAVYVHADAVRAPSHAVFFVDLVGFVGQVPTYASETWTLAEADEPV